MEFIPKLDITEYENFVSNNTDKSHFLQSSLWGEFSKIDKGFIPHYVGIKEKGKLICASMLLEKKLVLGFSYFYAPRGFVMDFTQVKVLEFFTKKLKKYVKQQKGIFLKIDPDVLIKQWDDEGKEVMNDLTIYHNLIKLGYQHLGFTNRFETSQPRFTFRINFDQPFEKVEEHFSKTTKQRIKKATNLGVKVSLASTVDEFYQLTSMTENRKEFVTHPKKYYEDLYQIFHQNGNCEIFLGSINIDEILEQNKVNLNKLETEKYTLNQLENLSKNNKKRLLEIEKTLEKTTKDCKLYQDAKEQYGNELILSAHFIVSYGDKAWVLYAGNHNDLSFTYANYKTYYEHIKYYYDKGIKVYDQFGTVGKLEQNDPLLGLHEFKKKFGGDYIEFVGEFDLITNPFMYIVFKKLIPFYRKKKLKQNISKLNR